MATWHKALDLDELAEGRVKTVTVDQHWICMTHHDGKYGALDNACPHQGESLSEGSLDGTVITCAAHNWKFDVTTGDSPVDPEAFVYTFKTKIEDEYIWVKV